MNLLLLVIVLVLLFGGLGGYYGYRGGYYGYGGYGGIGLVVLILGDPAAVRWRAVLVTGAYVIVALDLVMFAWVIGGLFW